ncbi:hypothetical protein FBU30_006654 [Linnemannia zychae]|nr:hypothetical protein FBU30_006654 [Linnemannia zychae]
MSTVAGSPAKSKASAFKERFVLDLAQECHRSLPKSPSPSTTIATTATAASSPSRRVSSGSSSFQNQQQHQQQQYQDYTMNRNTNLYYPLQFSTRARAMEYLIEILQSLQKEPCGCDLVKGCYCGQDGIEDHEGKSPCYVCGEWYPDRCGTGAGTGIGLEGDVDSMKSAQQRQGKSWHEQGSLRHHVAEAKVKKWLDSVWRPPLTPATSPEQENVRQFGLRRSQGDLRYCFDQPHYSSQHHSSQQQQSGYMESGRPWSVYDIEIEARAKSRSRNNSASSSYSLPLVTSPSAFYPLTSSARNLAPYPTPYSSQQDLSGSTQGYGSNSWLWQFTTSPSPSQSSTSKSYFQAPPPSSESYNVPFFGIANKQEYQARARTTSCSDAPLPYNGATPLFAGSSSSLRSSTPPAMRSNSIHTSHMNNIDRTGRSKPVRASTANTTYSIPQEILDPSYRSPTFRIKSWNPNTSSTSSSPLRSAGLQQKEKQNLDTWTPVAKTTFSSSQGESVLKSIKVECSDQEDAMALLLPGANGQQGNTREDPRPTYMGHQTPIRAEVGAELCKVAEVKKSAPFQFNFTSERFRAAVQAKASVDFNNSDHDHNDSNPIKTTTTVQVESTIEHITDGVQKSAALSEAIHHSPSSTMVPTTCVTQVCCLDEKDQVKAVKRTVPIHVETVPEQAESHEELSAKAPSYEYRHESESLNISSKSSLQTSSRLLPIQKSAPMSPSTSQGNDGISPNGESMRTATTKVTTMTSAKAMSHRAHASLNTPGSSSLASTSASTSVSSN